MTKRAWRRSPGAASCHYLNSLFKDTAKTTARWVGVNSSRAVQPLEMDGALNSQKIFFFQINAHFLPHFAIGPLSDTKFYPFTFSCLYFITFYRCFQTQITPALCHWYTPAIELKLAGGGKWHFFPLNGWETPSLPHPISYQVCHFFLPNVSRICFSLSTPTITTLVQDSTTSYCCNSRLLLLLPLASSSSPTQSTTIRTLFLLFYHSLAQKSLGAPHCPRNKVQPKLRLQTLCAGPSEQGRHDYSFMAFTD